MLRLEPGTIVEDILAALPADCGETVVDATRCGMDLARRINRRAAAVCVDDGVHPVRNARGLLHVRQPDLISGLSGLISEKRIRFDREHGGPLLLGQLQELRGAQPDDPNTPRAWRKRERVDDLVTACSLGCWWLSRKPDRCHQPPAPRRPVEVRPPTLDELWAELSR